MEHHHYTNIEHGHTAYDKGHVHKPFVDANWGGSGSGSAWLYGVADYQPISVLNQQTAIGYADIVVNGTGENQKYSSGSISDINWTARTQTDSNNTNNNENRPENFTIKIWKRTA